MLSIISCILVAQCAILLALLLVGKKLRQLQLREKGDIAHKENIQWPRMAMIVPVGGNSPHMASALTSLLAQDYPEYIPIFVTETADEPAATCIRHLQNDFPLLRHVVAGHATNCGQKNHNTLAGLASVADDNIEIYTFCDSTHLAPPDFLRLLVAPIAQGKSDFSTGYHSVEHFDEKLTTLAYCASVLLMRLLQGFSRFTQPWGGAMAIRSHAFRREHVDELWATSVVDDCSLAALLLRRKIHVSLCTAALLKTVARDHSMSVWHDWMERQILFLKFCIPFQWKLLGILVVCMAFPPLFASVAFLGGFLGIGSGEAVALGLCWLAVFWCEMSYLRSLLDKQSSPIRFVGAFTLACLMFAKVYIGTLNAHSILWQGRTYHVGENGEIK